MKFGKVDNPQDIDFTLPKDHPDTLKVLKTEARREKLPEIYVGCAKWNKTDLKGFYPKGTKDELTYYSRAFNSIELNATFYYSPLKEQVLKWKEKTPDTFKFFPKIPQNISHFKRLSGAQEQTQAFCENIRAFQDQLGMVFLQMNGNFKSNNFSVLEQYIYNFPADIPLAIEVRSNDWLYDNMGDKYYELLRKNGITNIITDTAAYRDLMHMRLTTPIAFIRYVGANHASDYKRLDDWLDRLEHWINGGIHKIYFFIHQNMEEASPLLSAYFIKKLNKRFDFNLHIPTSSDQFSNLSLGF